VIHMVSIIKELRSFIHLMSKGVIAFFARVGKKVDIKRNCILLGKINLEDNVTIGENCFLNGHIYISKGTDLEKNVELVGNIKIGKYCAIARNVTFQGVNHSIRRSSIQMKFYKEVFDDELERVSKGPIVVGNDVWIGTRAIILSDVKIGDGAIIGAGSIVTKDVEPYSIVAGVPAVRKKWRFPEYIRKQLLEIKWWDWDIEKIKRNKEFFMVDLTRVKNLHELIEE